MKVVCPKCRDEIPVEDFNVSSDLARCRPCKHSHKLSRLIEEQRKASMDPDHPPKGAWFRQSMDGFEVGVTTRSASAFFLVPFMCVWSGGSLGGIYGSQIAEGEFNLAASLFGIPFLLGTLLFGSIALMAACGKITVRVRGNDGVIFAGVGSLGWRRRFAWDGVSSIRITERRDRRNWRYHQLTLHGQQELDFANGVSRQRLDFMLGALRQMMKHRR